MLVTKKLCTKDGILGIGGCFSLREEGLLGPAKSPNWFCWPTKLGKGALFKPQSNLLSGGGNGNRWGHSWADSRPCQDCLGRSLYIKVQVASLSSSSMWKACKLRPQKGNILALSLANRRGWLGPDTYQLQSFRWLETPTSCQFVDRPTRLPSRGEGLWLGRNRFWPEIETVFVGPRWCSIMSR